MKKYLDDLRNALKKKNVNEEEIEEVINDLSEMIATAIKEGLPESEVENKFGSPEKVASEIKSGSDNDGSASSSAKKDVFKHWKSFDQVGGPITVAVELPATDVIYTESPGDTINILHHGDGNLDAYHLDFDGKTLHLTAPKMKSFSIFNFRSQDAVFKIEIPKEQSVTAYTHRTTSGDVYFGKLETHALDLKTISGDVAIKESITGETRLNSVSGDILFEAIKATSLQVSQVSGDLEFVDTVVETLLKLNTVSGDVRVGGLRCDEAALHMVSGDIRGKEFYPGRFSFKSVSGDLIVENSKDESIKQERIKTLSGEIRFKRPQEETTDSP